jgi:hypothetical protein
MAEERWWAWYWDHHTTAGAVDSVTLEYKQLDRWRRGWVTLYRYRSKLSTVWDLYLPGNFKVGYCKNHRDKKERDT